MIDEETLILYYYDDDLSARERRKVERALASDRVLAARFAALRESLDALADAPVASAPTHMKLRWHDAIAREARLERQHAAAGSRGMLPWLGLGSALAATLALGFAIGVFLPERDSGPEVRVLAETGNDARTENPDQQHLAFERGLTLHLEESRQDLVGLTSRSAAERHALLLEIIAQNRLFEQAAEKQQVPEIARLMRALEPVLLQLVATDAAPGDAEALREQLAFELQAMLTKLQRSPSKESTRT